MKFFQKQRNEGWLKATGYQMTQEEIDILGKPDKTEEEADIASQTSILVNEKAYTTLTEDELAWCENIYNTLMIRIGSAEFEYSLEVINLTQDITENQGIKFNGILNYMNGNEFSQYRF